ncbi:hypothetical protein LRS03_20535 [Rhizobacter sp. J219]|uniref:hypothetical protein n=1 Tax=Rhizobacter sp. J219 TaxID=2898430 RepID=UPI002151BAFD|nr:hypothetical protein [Rhizobacter sp. J219]MCR5885118.1 hypothetical protein [Rhizobacter sp. J219]
MSLDVPPHRGEQARRELLEVLQLPIGKRPLVLVVVEVDRQHAAVGLRLGDRQPLAHAVALVDGFPVVGVGDVVRAQAQHRRALFRDVEGAVAAVQPVEVGGEAVARGVAHAVGR